MVNNAFSEANCGWDDLDAVAATAGPGLIGGVIVGLMTAKAIALVRGIPLIAVNHLEGHALTARLTDAIAFPYLLLLVSGGHTQLQIVEMSAATGGLAPPSTMPWAKPSTRPPNFWVWASRAAQRSSAPLKPATPNASPCRARLPAGRAAIFRSPASRRPF